MKTQSFTGVITLLLLVTTSLQAGVIPGRWEKLDAQPVGTPIIVTLEGGDRMKCDFKSSGADAVTVTDESGVERKLPKSAIDKILSADKKVVDNVLDGTLIFAGVLAAPTAILGRSIIGEESREAYVNTVLMMAAIGAGIGAGIDLAYKSHEVLYKAP